MATRASQSEAAYLRILERIVSLEMPPGSVVQEAQLREELKIGRTPIREALQRLALENLVKSDPPPRNVRHRRQHHRPRPDHRSSRRARSHAAKLAAEAPTADRQAISELLDVLERVRTDQRELMDSTSDPSPDLSRARNSVPGEHPRAILQPQPAPLVPGAGPRGPVAGGRRRARRAAPGDPRRRGPAGGGHHARHVIGFEREIRKALVER